MTPMEALQDPKRYRGFVLTAIGLQKLQGRIQQLEVKTGVRQGARAIAERVQLMEPHGIHPMTVRKLLRGQQGVDKRSIDQVFAALQLTLETGDYAHASLLSNASVELGADSAKTPEGIEKRITASTKSDFCGRSEEQSRLRQQILVNQCRLLVVLGAAGIGKTAFVKELAIEIEPAFECFAWKTLHPAPGITETLTELLQSLLVQLDISVSLPTTVEGLISSLLRYLRHYRCLLVFDGVESILSNRPLAGYYREEYEAYGELFRAIAESLHTSCLILTSQEKPRGVKRLENQFVQVLRLQGLNASDSQYLLQKQGIATYQLTDWQRVVDYYAGNPLLLKLAAVQIADYFDSNISAYLNEVSYEQWLFQDVRDVLDQQFNRITQPEQRVMLHLALAEDWVPLSDLQAALTDVISRHELLDVLDSLWRRSLFRKNGTCFKLTTAMAEFIRHYKSR